MGVSLRSRASWKLFGKTIEVEAVCMYNACMATSITIRSVPDETRDELAARAARGGRSLQEYLRSELIALASKPDIDALIERVDRRKRANGSSLSASRIVEYRDAARR